MTPPTCWCSRQRHPHHVHRPRVAVSVFGLLWFPPGPYCPDRAVELAAVTR